MSGRLFAALVLMLLAAAGAVQLAACGGTTSDPFVGSWWEPSSGRRVQVQATGDGYEVLIGSNLKASPATKSGAELRLTDPELGPVVLKIASDDTLQLVAGGAVSMLERSPQHQ